MKSLVKLIFEKKLSLFSSLLIRFFFGPRKMLLKLSVLVFDFSKKAKFAAPIADPESPGEGGTISSSKIFC